MKSWFSGFQDLPPNFADKIKSFLVESAIKQNKEDVIKEKNIVKMEALQELSKIASIEDEELTNLIDELKEESQVEEIRVLRMSEIKQRK